MRTEKNRSRKMVTAHAQKTRSGENNEKTVCSAVGLVAVDSCPPAICFRASPFGHIFQLNRTWRIGRLCVFSDRFVLSGEAIGVWRDGTRSKQDVYKDARGDEKRMQKLRSESVMRQRSWADIVAAVQSVALSCLSLCFLRFISSILSLPSRDDAIRRSTGALLLQLPSHLPLGLACCCLVILALTVARSRSCRCVVLVFGIINGMLLLYFFLLMCFCTFPLLISVD